MLPTYPTNLNYGGIEKRLKDSQKNLVAIIKANIVNGELKDGCEELKTFKKTYKKIQKSHYLIKNIRSYLVNDNSKYLINHFRQCDNDYGESWVDVYVFKTTNLELVKSELENMGIQIDGSSWTSAYDCTGWAFYRGCDFIELSDRIIVTQSGGLDV